MSVIKIEDVAHVRFRAPELGEMRAFLGDFGLAVTEASEARLVARGSGASPVLHVTELGEPRVCRRGVPRRVRLPTWKKLAAAEGVAVTAI